MAPSDSLLPKSQSCCWRGQRVRCGYRNLIPAPNWTPSQILKKKSLLLFFVVFFKAGNQHCGPLCSRCHLHNSRNVHVSEAMPGSSCPPLSSFLPPGYPASPAVPRHSLLCWFENQPLEDGKGNKMETRIPLPCSLLYSSLFPPNPDPTGT